MKGFTCGTGDAFLIKRTEKNRKKIVALAEWRALNASAKVHFPPYTVRLSFKSKMIGIEIDKDIETKPSELRKETSRVAKELGCLYRSDHNTSTVHDSNIKGTSPT